MGRSIWVGCGGWWVVFSGRWVVYIDVESWVVDGVTHLAELSHGTEQKWLVCIHMCIGYVGACRWVGVYR